MAKLNRDVIKDAYSLDLARELILNRYLLNTILSNLFLINEQMNQQFAIIGGKKRKEKQQKESTKERKVKRKEKKATPLETISFEKFSIGQQQYKALVAEYGQDVINEAVVLMDGYLRRTKRTLKDPYQKLKTWAVSLVMKKRLSNMQDDVMRMTGDVIDLDNIKSMDEAIRYIRKVPAHLRNIDAGCKMLVDKFKIGEQSNGTN